MLTPIANADHRLPPSGELAHRNGFRHAHATEPEEKGESPLEMIFDRLRGRWRFAIPLGVVLGGFFAAAGYKLTPLKYESVGVVRVAASGKPVIYEVDDVEVKNYSGELRNHIFRLTSREVVGEALRDPALSAAPIADPIGAREGIARSLRVWNEPGSELINVAYESQSPDATAKIVNAVLGAFEKLYGEGGMGQRARRTGAMRAEAEDLQKQQEAIRASITEIVTKSEYGVTDLEQIVAKKVIRAEELKQEIEQIDLDLSLLPDAIAGTGEGGDGRKGDGTAGPRQPSRQDLVLLEPMLHILYTEREDVRSDLSLYMRKYNATHPIYLRAKSDLEMIEGRIATRERLARDRWEALGGVIPRAIASAVTGGTGPGALGLNLLSPEQLAERRDGLEQLRLKAREEIAALHREQNQINELLGKSRQIDEELAMIRERIRRYQVESDPESIGGRVEIMQWAEAPLGPSKDRRSAVAGLGFCGGLGLSFGLFFLLGTFDRRTYSSRQLKAGTGEYRCLGVLPDLRARRLDAELSETASHCVHQIRNRIEALRDPVSSFILLVSSPYQGDGKTSLVMSLGWSYAAAGHRTLLVDFDFFGRSLTRQMGVFASEGLKEVLRDRRFGELITPMPLANLSVLGAGLDPVFGSESIRKDDVAALCSRLRQEYDIIIIDTGPFTGSIELLPVAASVDSVVFSVRRGRPRNRLDDCIEDLKAINVQCLGVVLNCADHADCQRYVSKSLVSTRAPEGEEEAPGAENALVRALEPTAMRGK